MRECGFLRNDRIFIPHYTTSHPSRPFFKRMSYLIILHLTVRCASTWHTWSLCLQHLCHVTFKIRYEHWERESVWESGRRAGRGERRRRDMRVEGRRWRLSAPLQTLGPVARPRHEMNATTWPQHVENIECLIANYYKQIKGVNDWVRIPAGELVTFYFTSLRPEQLQDAPCRGQRPECTADCPPNQFQGYIPGASSSGLVFLLLAVLR